MSSPRLQIALLQAFAPAGTVLVVNAGQEPLRLWRLGCSLGDETLSFSIATTEGPAEIQRKPQVYTVNPPATVQIQAGETYSIPFDLDDGSWAPPPPPRGISLRARFLISDSDDARGHDVWTGAITSDPVPLEGS